MKPQDAAGENGRPRNSAAPAVRHPKRQPLRRPVRIVLLSACFLSLCACAPRYYPEPSLREPLQDFSKWERVVEAERRAPSFPASGHPPLAGERLRQWRALTAQAESGSKTVLVVEVNRFFNRWPYKEDSVLWGENDYWATPREFMARSGDCEDYATAKYYALRHFGIPAEDLRIALVERSRRGGFHAVLLARTEMGRLMLDSASDVVSVFVPGEPYIPLFYLNEDFLWRRPPAEGTKKPAP